MEYADVVWDNCTNTEKHEIEKIQHEAAFIVTGATRSCPKPKLLEETGWESLDHRRYKHRLTTFHKMIYKETPSYLHSLAPQSVHQVSKRKSQVKVKYSNTTMQVKFVSKFISKQNG